MSAGQNNLNIRQSVDDAGQSTFVKDVKIVGGIKNYSTQDSTYGYWGQNRKGQEEYQPELLKNTKMDRDAQDPRKCLRSSEIYVRNCCPEDCPGLAEYIW